MITMATVSGPSCSIVSATSSAHASVHSPASRAVLAAVAVRVGDVAHAVDERLERRADRRDAGDRERAHGRAVVGDLARDDLAPHRLAVGGVVLARQLPGRLDRLGAAGDEERAVDARRRELGEPGGELGRGRVRERPVRVVRQLAHLLERGLAELLAVRVADLHGEQPAEHVEVALAVRVEEVRALAALDDRDLLVAVAAHRGEVQPEVILRLALQLRVHARVDRHLRPPLDLRQR